MAPKSTTGRFEGTDRTQYEDGYTDLTIEEIDDETMVTSIAVHSSFGSNRTLSNVFPGGSLDRFMSGPTLRGDSLTEKFDRMRDGIELSLRSPLGLNSSLGVMP